MLMLQFPNNIQCPLEDDTTLYSLRMQVPFKLTCVEAPLKFPLLILAATLLPKMYPWPDLDRQVTTLTKKNIYIVQ